MKSYIYRLSLLATVLSALSVNIALADEGATQAFNNDGITVTYHDLNLANSEGLDSLYRRVESAARKVCGVENFRVSLNIARKNRDCVSSSINAAIGQIGDTRLTALHRAKVEAVHRS